MEMQFPAPTPRLRFRAYLPTDAASVADMFADPFAQRFYPAMADTNKAADWIRWNLDSYATHRFGLWVIEDRATGSFLGDCGLTYQQVETQQVLEVGYHLQEQHRGHGYATEAGRACIAFAFDELDASQVCSIVHPANTASLAVATRLHASRRPFINDNGDKVWLYWSTST